MTGPLVDQSIPVTSGFAVLSLTVGTSTSDIPDPDTDDQPISPRSCAWLLRSDSMLGLTAESRLIVVITPVRVASLAAMAASLHDERQHDVDRDQCDGRGRDDQCDQPRPQAPPAVRDGGRRAPDSDLRAAGRSHGGRREPRRRSSRVHRRPAPSGLHALPRSGTVTAADPAGRNRSPDGCGSAALPSRRSCAAGTRCRWRPPNRHRRSRFPTRRPAAAGGTARRWR